MSKDIGSEAENIVIILHGIRTHASWAEMVSATLEKEQNIKVIPVKYGFFDTLKFVSPFFTRRAPIQKAIREYRDIKMRYPNSKISLIAHSFGTYIFSKMLEEPDIKFYRVVLCGSIIKEDFRWVKFSKQIQSQPILNDCGTHDIWPIVAKSVTWGYGASGTFGFGGGEIKDRFNKFGHSEYFSKDYVERFWFPFINSGVIIPTEWEQRRSTPPYWQSVLSIFPIRWLFLLLPILLSIWGFNQYKSTKVTMLNAVSPIIVGHVLGTAIVGIDLNVENNKNNNVFMTDFNINLIAPSGVKYSLNLQSTKQLTDFPYYQPLTGLMSIPPTFQIYPNQKLSFGLHFMADPKKQRINYMAVEKYLRDNNTNLSILDLSKEIIPEPLIEKLHKAVIKYFIWEPGNWSIQISYLLDGQQKQLNHSFVLSKSDIDNMELAIPFYHTGLGVLLNWTYLSPNNTLTVRKVQLN